MKKNIWIVSELFYPETISTGYIITEIAKHLSNDYSVNVITGPEYYEKKQQQNDYKPLENINVFRIKSNGYNKNIALFRLLGHLSVTLKMALLMIKKIPKNSDVLLVTNPVFLMPLVSLFIKRKKWSVKLLIHDVFPDNLLISGLLKSKRSYLYRLLTKIFNSSLKRMHTLIVCGRDMKVLYEEKIKSSKEIIVIENWADVDNISIKANENKKTNFLFAGNLGRVQGLESLLDIIKEMGDLNCDFTFIGNGALKKYIDDFIEDNKLDNVKALGWMPREEQDDFLSKSTVGLISLKQGMFGLGVPSKLYNLLASGKPIFYIGDNNSEIHLVLKENQIGWFAEANNKEMIKTMILEIINTDSEKMTELSISSRKLAVNRYSKKIILDKINKLFS